MAFSAGVSRGSAFILGQIIGRESGNVSSQRDMMVVSFLPRWLILNQSTFRRKQRMKQLPKLFVRPRPFKRKCVMPTNYLL